MTATALTSSVENQTCQGHQFTTSNYKQYDIAKKHGNPWLDATKRDARFIASDYTIVEVKQGKKRNEHYLNLVFQHKNICDCQNTVPYSHLLKNVTFIQNVMQKGKNVLNSSVDFVKDKAAKVHDFYLEHEKPIVFTLAGAAIVGGLVTGGFSAAATISALGSVSPYAIMSNGMQTDKIIHAQPKTQTATTTNIPYTQPAVNVPIYEQKYVFPNSPLPLTAITATDLSRPLGYGLTTNYPQTSSLHNTPQYQSLMANMDMTAIYQAPVIQNSMDLSSVGQAIKRTTSDSKVPLGTLVKQATKDTFQKASDYLFKNTKALHKKVDPSNKLLTQVYKPTKTFAADFIKSPAFNGSMQTVTGTVEVAVGCALTGTGFTAPLGAFLLVHGSDQVSTGLQTLFTNKHVETISSQMLQKTGLSPENAQMADNLISVLATMGGTSVLKTSKLALNTLVLGADTIELQQLKGKIRPNYNQAYNRAQFEQYKSYLRTQMEKPRVYDTDLQGIVNRNFRPNAQIGNKSTAAAIRYEKMTGKKVKGKLHGAKGEQEIKSITRWIEKHPSAIKTDIEAAENMLKDLQNALRE